MSSLKNRCIIYKIHSRKTLALTSNGDNASATLLALHSHNFHISIDLDSDDQFSKGLNNEKCY